MALRLYRALLRLFPASFRHEYGDEMSAVFARDLREASGLVALLALWTRTTIDIVLNAAGVHLDIVRQDIRYSLRSLRRSPGFTITAICVAALGVGATTATFSIADFVLLRPLPFSDPDRLVKVWQTKVAQGYGRLEPSPPNYRDWKQVAKSFESMEAYISDGASMVGVGDPQRLSGARTTGGMFRLLGVSAAIGRVLVESDVSSETQNPILISDALWRARFGADPQVIGRAVSLDDATHVVVGVMPKDFHFPSRGLDFWRPLRFTPNNGDDDRTNHYLQVLARLRDDVTLEAARSEMEVIAAQLLREYPKELADSGTTVIPWRNEISQQPRMLLFALVGAAMCVLLIACTNLANLLLSRALVRRTELALRAAVGASMDRLVRQMLTDSLLLAGAGGVLGVILSIVSAPLVVRMIPTALPIAEVPPIDSRMLALAGLVTLTTGIAFGVVPALRVGRKTDLSALKDGSRGGTGRGTERLRSALVVAEIVASVVLLVSAGLLVQALIRVQETDPGFRAESALTLRTTLPRPKYIRTDRRGQFYDRVIGEVQALPGVRSAAYISFLPMTMRGGIWPILTTTPDPKSPQLFVAPNLREQHNASLRFVTPGFFQTIGTPVLAGRDVSAADTLDTPLVAVVSRSFVRMQYPDQDPLGRSFAIAFGARTIVGIVGDIRVRGLERDSEPQVYLPASQMRDAQLGFYAPQDLVIRSTVPPSTLIPAVRSIVTAADPQLPITNMRSLEEVVSLETAPRLVQLRVIGAFAVAAFVLAAVGIHGLLGFAVAARGREIGVRMALGAKSTDILKMVVGRSFVLAGIGVAIGVLLAYVAGRSMQSLLAGVDPLDVAVFAGAVALSLLMTVAGSLLPAVRAVKTDPLTATRAE